MLTPKRIKLGQNRVAWYWEEIKAWVAERAAQRETSKPANDTSF
jgi:predicted DNA-binding transcriptional regulator AlpA